MNMYLKIQDIFTRRKEFLPDMSGGQMEFCENCPYVGQILFLEDLTEIFPEFGCNACQECPYNQE